MPTLNYDLVVQYAVPILLAGLAIAALALLRIVVRTARDWRWWAVLFPITVPVYAVAKAPRTLLLALLGLAVAASPAVITRLAPIDLGPHERVVDGELHLTLTGWDRPAGDYAGLRQKPDVVVLQMANADVTDATLAYLAGMARLRKLDVGSSQVTDEGLKALAGLPALEELILTKTRVTDAGVRTVLTPMEALKRLNVQQTAVSAEAVQAWREAKAGRRALR